MVLTCSCIQLHKLLIVIYPIVVAKGMTLASTVWEYYIILFRNLKAKLNVIVFYVLSVMADLMIIACQLYYLCDASSMVCEMVCLIQTLQHDAVTFLVYGWMFVDMDPI